MLYDVISLHYSIFLFSYFLFLLGRTINVGDKTFAENIEMRQNSSLYHTIFFNISNILLLTFSFLFYSFFSLFFIGGTINVGDKISTGNIEIRPVFNTVLDKEDEDLKISLLQGLSVKNNNKF